jgi:cytoskeletal protein RodZ
MAQPVSTQHPAVVLKSHFNALRALLVAALIAVIGLTVAVVILANDEQQVSTSQATPEVLVVPQSQAQSGPSESTIAQAISSGAGSTSASGPDESRTAAAIGTAVGTTSTGGPDESRIADAISSGSGSTSSGGPSESVVADAVAGD